MNSLNSVNKIYMIKKIVNWKTIKKKIVHLKRIV